MRLKSFFLAVAVLFFGCEDDESTVPTLLFTLIVEDSFETTTTDNWIIIHDEEGAPIAFEPFESGAVIQLKTDLVLKGNEIGVTLLKYGDVGGKKQYSANTYLQYEKGGTLTLDSYVAEPFSTGTSIGKFDVTVNSTNLIHQYSVTNMFAVGEVQPHYDMNNFTFTGYLTEVSSKYLLQASDVMGNIRYKMLEDIEANASFTFDFDELLEFDKTFEFTFPESSDVIFTVAGREAGQSIGTASYLHHLHVAFNSNDTHTNIKGGYLNSLTGYHTTLNVRYPSYRLFYYNKGSIPEAKFSSLSPDDYSISSKDIRNFSASSTNPFVYRNSLFSYAQSVGDVPVVYWYITSSSNNHTFQGLPKEILTSHPLLNLANLKHVATSFYVESPPYQKAILPEWKLDKYIYRGITIY